MTDPLTELRAETSRRAKALAELDRSLAALARSAAKLDAAPHPVLDGIRRARELVPKAAGAPELEPALADLEASARAALERAATRFGTALAAALREHVPGAGELKPTDSGFAFGAARLVVDGAAGRVHLEYARLPVVKNVAMDPEAVAKAVAEFLAGLDKPPFEPGAFLEAVRGAYTLALAAASKAPGELVDILAFHGHLAWQLQPDGFRREPTARRFRDYPLVRFAHDLARLRAARQFEVSGKRLELEVAVHDRAYGKSLWVPEEKSGGSYYQAIALR